MVVVISKMETTASDDMLKKGRVNRFDLHFLYMYWNFYDEGKLERF